MQAVGQRVRIYVRIWPLSRQVRYNVDDGVYCSGNTLEVISGRRGREVVGEFHRECARERRESVCESGRRVGEPFPN